jgi:hypothetical protein
MGATRASYGLGHVPGRGRTPTTAPEGWGARLENDVGGRRLRPQAAADLRTCEDKDTIEAASAFSPRMVTPYVKLG